MADTGSPAPKTHCRLVDGQPGEPCKTCGRTIVARGGRSGYHLTHAKAEAPTQAGVDYIPGQDPRPAVMPTVERVADLAAALAAGAPVPTVAPEVPEAVDFATDALLAGDQGVCPEGHPCQLTGDSLRACAVDHRETGVPYHGRPIFADGLTARDLAYAADYGVRPGLLAWAREALADRADSQTSTAAADRLMAEAEVLAMTIAETLADGVLPLGLFGNEARLTRVVNRLRDAIEVMGEEVDVAPVEVDRADGRDLGWIVSANEVAPHDVDRARRIISDRLAAMTEDLRQAGLGVWAEAIR